MEGLKISLKKINEIELSFDKETRVYLPIYGTINVFLNGRLNKIVKGDGLILNSNQVVLLYPLLEDRENLVFELKLDDRFLERHYRTDIILNSFLQIDFTKTNIFYLVNELYQDPDRDNKNMNLAVKNIIEFIDQDKLSMPKVKVYSEKEYRILNDYFDKVDEDEGYVDHNLEDIADYYKVSSSYFSRLFKHVTGISLGMFKQLMKLKKSSHGLLYTDKTLEEIAYSIGYQSTKSLYDIYRGVLGILPSDYRKALVGQIRYKEESLRKSYIYNQFLFNLDRLNYQEFYEEVKLNQRQIDCSKNMGNYAYGGLDIYDIGLIGHDFKTNIDSLSENIRINFIYLDFSLDRNLEGFIYLNGLNSYLTQEDFIKLLFYLNNKGIRIGLSLSIKDKEIKTYDKNDYREISNIEDYISQEMGDLARSFRWIIRIDGGPYLGYMEKYLHRRINGLKRIFEEDFSLAVDLGDLSLNVLDKNLDYLKLRGLYDECDRIYFTILEDYEIEFDKKLKDGKISFDFRRRLEGLKKDKKVMPLKFKIKYRLGVNKPLAYELNLYRDLFLSYMNLNNGIFAGLSESLYFELIELGSLETIPSRLIRKRQLETSLLQSLRLVQKLKGRLIERKPGLIVVEDRSTIKILLTNKLEKDFIFARDGSYKELVDNNRRLKLVIKGLRGNYRVTQEKIGFAHGNALKYLNDFKDEKNLTDEEKLYISQVDRPERKARNIRIEENYEFSVNMEPFSILYLELKSN